jgi:Glycosyltransferases involved in cell wall biogenesis
MAEKSRLLSICIPTYNRGNILKKTLNTYVNDPHFDSSLEIIISDNCSEDETQEIGKKFAEDYDNIFYYRNETNLRDINFIKALSYGNGKYLKLMNDTVTFQAGKLQLLKDILNIEAETGNHVLFYQNIPYLNANKTVKSDNINDLVANVSHWITWIANFGVWKDDFEKLKDKDRCFHLQFLQSDWTIRLTTAGKSCNIYFNDFFEIEKESNKRPYNLFIVFGRNYLSLYDEYLHSGLLKKSVFNNEQYRLFRYFFVGWYKILVIPKNDFFETDNAFNILLQIYKFKPYFYLGIAYAYVSFGLKKIKDILK